MENNEVPIIACKHKFKVLDKLDGIKKTLFFIIPTRTYILHCVKCGEIIERNVRIPVIYYGGSKYLDERGGKK